MRAERIYVYGAGGHGKVVADILISRGETGFAGFVDDREELRNSRVLGFPVFGGSEWLRRECSRARLAVALGVGDCRSRRMVMDRCCRWGIDVLTPVHPNATVARSATLGRGAAVMAGAIINSEARLSEGVIVNTGAVVEHDAVIGDYAHVAPIAAMGGAARLGPFSLLGLGAIALQRVVIGSHTIVGAGAVVVEDLPDRVVAVGVPARIRRWLEQQEIVGLDEVLQNVTR